MTLLNDPDLQRPAGPGGRAVEPGDVLITRSKKSAFARLIRLGTDSAWNHVAVAHHTDAAGVAWGIEGRPGGVGWVDLRSYLDDGFTLTNVRLTKTPEQRSAVCTGAVALLGTPYDWAGILGDSFECLAPRLDALWRRRWAGSAAPGHVVCSSLADWLYASAGLPSPGLERETSPADWAALILAKGWSR